MLQEDKLRLLLLKVSVFLLLLLLPLLLLLLLLPPLALQVRSSSAPNARSPLLTLMARRGCGWRIERRSPDRVSAEVAWDVRVLGGKM